MHRTLGLLQSLKIPGSRSAGAKAYFSSTGPLGVEASVCSVCDVPASDTASEDRFLFANNIAEGVNEAAENSKAALAGRTCNLTLGRGLKYIMHLSGRAAATDEAPNCNTLSVPARASSPIVVPIGQHRLPWLSITFLNWQSTRQCETGCGAAPNLLQGLYC